GLKDLGGRAPFADHACVGQKFSECRLADLAAGAVQVMRAVRPRATTRIVEAKLGFGAAKLGALIGRITDFVGAVGRVAPVALGRLGVGGSVQAGVRGPGIRAVGARAWAHVLPAALRDRPLTVPAADAKGRQCTK